MSPPERPRCRHAREAAARHEAALLAFKNGASFGFGRRQRPFYVLRATFAGLSLAAQTVILLRLFGVV